MSQVGKRYPLHIRKALEKAHKDNPDASGTQIKEIALKTGLKITEVRRWFQLKRYRLKKLTRKNRSDIFENNEKLTNKNKQKDIREKIDLDTTNQPTHDNPNTENNIDDSVSLEHKEKTKMNFQLKTPRKAPTKKGEITVKKIAIPSGVQWCLLLNMPRI